jgi:hypothetical protein
MYLKVQVRIQTCWPNLLVDTFHGVPQYSKKILRWCPQYVSISFGILPVLFRRSHHAIRRCTFALESALQI